MKKSLFYKIYFSVVAIFLVALIIGLFSFGSWLKSYEAAQPEQIIKILISNYIETGDVVKLQKDYNLSVSKYETKDGINNIFEENINGKEITYSTSALKSDDADISYTVFTDGKKLFDVNLKRDRAKKYQVASIKLDKSLYKSIKITTAENLEIKVNGITIKKEDRKNDSLPSVKNLTNTKDIINKQSIVIDNLLSEPDSVVAVSDGKETTLIADNGIYTATQNSPEKEKVEDIASKGASTYASYMFNDSSLTNIRKYIDSETDFYKNIKSTDVIFTMNHNGNRIDNLKITEFHKYSDSLYSCRVSLVNVLIRSNEEYKDYFDKYVYLRTDGDSYKIIDMQNAAE